jgi:polynucleotide 5'-hydroxyl-kinase GRC3/NOL9
MVPRANDTSAGDVAGVEEELAIVLWKRSFKRGQGFYFLLLDVMLSAIAARKAAQAAKQQQQQQQPEAHVDAKKEVSTTPLSTYELEPSPPNFVMSVSEAATPRKRKTRGQDTHRQKKMKRLTNADIGRTRYFEAEQPVQDFEDEDEDILQSEISRSRGSSPSQPPQDSAPEDGVVNGFIPEDPGPSRAYSPSRPILDSSEEEDESGLGQETDHLDYRRKNLETTHKVSHRIFIPKVDTNCFRLTSDDYKHLDVTNTAESGTLVLLSPGHSLTFVGATCIILLQGAITVLGTPLRPSLRSHRVFSPRSSPLASIEALEASSTGGEANCLKGKSLPQQILNAVNASDSIVIICPLVSGVEGLGNVCRTFEGVFDVVPDVRETEAEDAVGVEGFHPVRT